MMAKLRRELNLKEEKIHEISDENTRIQDVIRKLKRDTADYERLKEEHEKMQQILLEKDHHFGKLRYEITSYDD